MHAQASDLSADAGLKGIFADDVVMHRAAIKRLVQFARAIVGHRTEHWAGDIRAMAGEHQIFLDEVLSHGMDGWVAEMSSQELAEKPSLSFDELPDPIQRVSRS